MFKGRQVLVTGGTGLIGRPLVEQLVDQGAQVRVASLDDPSRAHPAAEFRRVNLMEFQSCLGVCRGVEDVFHLAGVKGSPAMTARKPASFFVPMMIMNANMMEAARRVGVERYLFTSSIGVYGPAEVLREDDVWRTFPSENDRFAGWAKRMGELQAQAYAIEFGWGRVAIVRPANVYGPHDNFDPATAMVVPSLIRRVVDGENPLRVWGDGSAVRDFIHAQDIAQGILLLVERGVREPVNLGSGVGVSIRELVDVIVRHVEPRPEVVWDTSQPSGDQRRVMDVSRATSLGFHPTITIEDGVRTTMEWYRKHRGEMHQRYDVFAQDAYV